MAIASVATEYVFSDFLLKDARETKYKGVRLELAVDKIVTFLAVGLPLFLISLAFAQEVSVGTQITCFAPFNFSLRQAVYVDSFCWAAVQNQVDSSTLWLHKDTFEDLELMRCLDVLHFMRAVKFFPYILLLIAILMSVPAVLWRFTAAPCLSSDLNFIMEELDRFYNRSIKLAKNLASVDDRDGAQDNQSALDLAEGCFKYPLVEQYLKTKRFSCSLVVKYMVCQCLTLLVLLLSCGYHCYYIFLASLVDEFPCDVRTGMLKNDSGVPAAVQCKMVAVGVFRLLSYINLGVYLLLTPLVVLAALGPARQSSGFLRAYEILPGFGALGKVKPIYNDLSMYLLFLKENLSELKSFKCLQVLELLQQSADEGFDTMCLLQTLSQVKTDVLDSQKMGSIKNICERDKPKN